ncbi:biotin--[acetyl-CoA-carboxylase] ligase [Aquabacterium sp. J223]|uniref:biotin--[acetyl-CoA-carboxylase] ligase n=1 Tax=Aquabacterium sp. J223 TaxID=2898431 RepID=UPI0021AD6712|nr:biotin--[acetyl-CoA-carboxylase] ligase [Aquabacterium sp. J223]UUX95915.1 biotin--[acetyl-CoA-carboxylase] ligase [Aquabacterium sp. J223]
MTGLRWDAEGLWLGLKPLLPSLSVEVVAQCPSTNTELLDRARRQPGRRADDFDPCLLVAEQQTLGRGRLGREWKSAAGASLTFSLSLPLSPRDWSGLSLAVGLALAEALDQAQDAPPRLWLKWPNDLWLLDAPGRGRKLGGILIETVPLGRRRLVVVGVGLNVLPERFDGLTSGLACLQEVWPDASAPAALHRLAAPLVRALLAFEREGFAPLAERFGRRDLLRGRPVRLHAPGATDPALDGVADGVGADAALCLRQADGTVQRVVSGEVSVRLVPDDEAVGGGRAC